MLYLLKQELNCWKTTPRYILGLLLPESVTPLRYSAQALDSTPVKKYPLSRWVKLRFFCPPCETDILHPVIRIEVTDSGVISFSYKVSEITLFIFIFSVRQPNQQTINPNKIRLVLQQFYIEGVNQPGSG